MNEFLEAIKKRIGKGKKVIFVDQSPNPHSLTGIFDHDGNHLQQRTLKSGKTFKVIKHYLTDGQYQDLLEPYFSDLSIQRFDKSRRVLVSGEIG